MLAVTGNMATISADRSDVTEIHLVAMADLAVLQHQSVWLCTSPLGACLGLTVFDPVAKVAGLLHGMLPESSIDPARAAARPGMFLDTGLTELLERALALGALTDRLTVCVAGGARILDETSYFNLGHRNFEVLSGLLERAGLKISARETGGLSNRALHLNTATGEVRLKISGQPKLKTLCKP